MVVSDAWTKTQLAASFDPNPPLATSDDTKVISFVVSGGFLSWTFYPALATTSAFPEYSVGS